MTPPRVLAVLGAVAVLGALGWFGPRLVGGPAFVDQVAIVNRSEFDVHVEVSGGDRRGWMSVTTAPKDSTTAARAVIDQGDMWIFRFSAQGRRGDELRVAEADLRQAGWTVQVPDAVIEGFRRRGAPPSP